MSKFFLGRLFSSGSKVSSTIKSVKPNVPRTKSEKLKRDLAIAKQQTKGSKAKLDQAIFNLKQQNKEFKKDRVYSGKELEQQKYFNKEREKKMGGGSDMQNTNVKKKYKGFSKLPETVQIKINKKLAKKV